MMTTRIARGLGLLGAAWLALASSPVGAQSQLIESINAAGRAVRAGQTTSGLAQLIQIAGQGSIETLAASLRAGEADPEIVSALRSNQFLPPPGFGTALTGTLSGGTITDRASGIQYRILSGGSTGWNPADPLIGFDGHTVTAWGFPGSASGTPAFGYSQMVPGESPSFVHGRLRGNQIEGKPIISAGNAEVVVENPALAELFNQWRSQGRGGVGVIVPGQLVESGGRLRLVTGGDSGFPDVPGFWVLTDIYGNGFGRAPLADGQYLYNAEVYGSNRTVVTVGPAFPNARARHAMHGNAVTSLDALPGPVAPQEYTATDSPVQRGSTWNPSVATGVNEPPRRFFIADAVTPDLVGGNFGYEQLQPGANADRLQFTLIDPGSPAGFGGQTGTPSSVDPAVREIIEGFSRQ